MDIKDVRLRPANEVERIVGRYLIEIDTMDLTGEEYYKRAACATFKEFLELFSKVLQAIPKQHLRGHKEITKDFRPGIGFLIFEVHTEDDFHCIIEASELKSREEFDRFKRVADSI